ncbi:MAG: hypothetical protein D6E12_14940 [Desulfovibrio sp.]|nr:MAG: hypothetical protein D6E12_14940 [Desulfovibrio sp.]
MQLQNFRDLTIDWDMSPEMAVTLYLEWGNNNWHGEFQPVRSKEDFTNYFLVDTWGEEPVVRLVRRNSEAAEDLAVVELPDEMLELISNEYGKLRGVFEPPEEIKEWLRRQLQ